MKKRTYSIFFAIVLATVLLNFIAWRSTQFCDFYVKYIFPFWINTYGRVTGLFSFSVGEIMIAMGVIMVISAIILGLLAVIFLLLARRSIISGKIKTICRYFYSSLAWVFVIVSMIMTLNCFILYHCSTFDEKYLQTEADEYTLEELTQLRDYVVAQANALSAEVKRDKNGKILYSGNLQKTAIESMNSLGEQYEQLAGYYPMPKPIATSEFLSQQHMKGYYFPFSMEANYNDVMDTMNKPATMCHELAHLKGFIYEDEANLIGFLACINSDDILFQYSGYLSVLNYIDNDFYEAIHKDKAIYKSHVQISPTVKKDNVFLTEDSWKKVEKKAVIKTATAKKMSRQFVETTLVWNGIEDGSLSYTRVVGLMLDYYDTNCDVFENGTYLVQGE